jgi:hypothetical protein
MKHLSKFSQFNEGITEKAYKSKDSDVKKEMFRDKIKDFLKSKSCKVEKVGDDFEFKPQTDLALLFTLSHFHGLF